MFKWITGIKYGFIILFTFYASHVYHEYKSQAKEIAHNKAVAILKEKLDKQERESVNVLAEKQRENSELASELRGRISDLVLANDSCNISLDAIRLRNQSLRVKRLSEDSSTPVETPTPTDRNEGAIEGVGISLLYENIIENDNICNDIRDQLEAIIKWDKETWQ